MYKAYTCKPYTSLRKSHDKITIDTSMSDCAFLYKLNYIKKVTK